MESIKFSYKFQFICHLFFPFSRTYTIGSTAENNWTPDKLKFCFTLPISTRYLARQEVLGLSMDSPDWPLWFGYITNGFLDITMDIPMDNGYITNTERWLYIEKKNIYIFFIYIYLLTYISVYINIYVYINVYLYKHI